MRTRVTALVIFVVLAIVAAAMLWPRRDSRMVRVAFPPIMASLPLFMAQENHLFQQQNVAVKTLTLTSSNDLVNALVAGQADILPAVSLVPLIHLEIQHPGKFRVFSHSRMRPTSSLYRITVKQDSPIRNIEDLRGKKLGVFPGTSATKLFTAFLAKYSIDAQSLTFVQLPPSAQVSSLESGAVDAIFAYEPLTATGPPGKYRHVHTSVYADLIDPCPLGVSVISREFERKHPEVAQKAVRAMLGGVRLMTERPAQAQALLPRFTKMTPASAARVQVADITLSDTVDVVNLQRFINLLYDIKEIPETIDAHRLVDPTP